MSPPRKDPITYQDKITLVPQKDQCLTSDVPPFLPRIKSLRNEENDDNPKTTNNSNTEKDDTSHTDRDNSIANVKEMKNNNDDDKYKEDTLKHQDGKKSVDNPESLDTSLNEKFINTTKEKEA